MRVLKSQSNGKVTQTPSMIGKEAEKSQIQRKIRGTTKRKSTKEKEN